jgi:hypothetical protein
MAALAFIVGTILAGRQEFSGCIPCARFILKVYCLIETVLFISHLALHWGKGPVVWREAL